MLKNFICPISINLSIFLTTLLFLGIGGGCSTWHLADSMSAANQISVRIPYVQGDATGELTSRIVEAVSAQPGFQVDESGRYILSIKLLDSSEEKIGFRYDPRKLRHGEKDLILNETRAKALAEVSLVDSISSTKICGPAYILGNIEYDHQENRIDNNINDLSLGQLSDVDTAQDVTYIPEYRDLAQKIGLWLQNQRDLQTKAEVASTPTS